MVTAKVNINGTAVISKAVAILLLTICLAIRGSKATSNFKDILFIRLSKCVSQSYVNVVMLMSRGEEGTEQTASLA